MPGKIGKIRSLAGNAIGFYGAFLGFSNWGRAAAVLQRYLETVYR